jgi:sterol desaturase/sphingolipid hydroxylase (fatty acid hydroxylase superfamily)
MDAAQFSAAVLSHAALIKLSVLLLLLAAFLLAEYLRPHRRMRVDNPRRGNNLLLSGAATASAWAMIWALPALGAATMAIWAAEQNIGLLNWLLSNAGAARWRAVFCFVFTLVALDFAMYWQHRFSHALPWLWRLHRVHHSDTGFDVTLGLRFHPGEIVLSLLYKSAVVLILGAPVLAYVIYEIVLMAMALFTHANIALPDPVERALARWLVTPELHRVHHSVESNDTNRNYGNWLSIWDWLFNSAAKQRADSATMPIGLNEFREARQQTLGALLTNPFQPKDPT